MIKEVILIVFSYLVGSCLFCLYITKLIYKVDIRKFGTKNPGTRNVYKLFGKIGILCGALDILKGVIPSMAAYLLGFNEPLIYLSGVAAVLGHMFSIYHKFKGGWGISTTIGVLLSLVVLQNKLVYEKYIILLGLLYILIFIIVNKIVNGKKNISYKIKRRR